MDNNVSFEYTYSAAQRQEIEQIRKKYLPPETDKMEQLRTLHNSATAKARAASISTGLFGTLVLGTGMSLILTELGAVLGTAAMPLGIGTGVAGLGLVALAYPVYIRVKKKEREKIAPEVLRLSEELLK